MLTNKTRPESKGIGHRMLLLLLAMVVLASGIATAQDYDFQMKQRRMGDTIGVEIWAKTLNASTPNLGDMSFVVQYNEEFLTPAAIVSGSNPMETTDSIFYDMDVANPVIEIESPFADALYGYSGLSASARDNGTKYLFQLDVNTGTNPTGYLPGTTGMGTYVGMLKFYIHNYDEITSTTNTEIMFSTSGFGPSALTDVDGNDITANATFTNPGDFTVRGIKVLNPNFPNQAINRYNNPPLASMGANNGYPIYFERSGLQNPAYGTYGSPTLGYYIEYSLNNGTSYAQVGYVAETTLDIPSMGANTNYYASGEIDYPSASNQRYLTQADGSALTATGSGYGGVLRTIWKANDKFPFRSEQALLRIKQLDSTGSGAAITNRNNRNLTDATRWDVGDFNFVLGRLFFVQLDGTSGYFKTDRTFSNSTQLTVEAWVNLNSIPAVEGSEPAIVASSAGPASPEEGAWMLYLEDGQYPAFRAREINDRGPNGYIGDVVSPIALTTTSDGSPIADAHGDNWRHIAATVSNNLVVLYVDGDEVGRYNNQQAFDIRMLTSDHPIWVGVNPNITIEAEDYLHAGVKEVKVWRVALSQDEIKNHISGVYNPTDMSLGDERTSLELYYPLQASRLDNASVLYEQNSLTALDYYENPAVNASPVNTDISYRPDRSHLRLTSPVGGEGISNLKDEVFPVRWVAYGIGSLAPNSEDIQIMASRDGGLTWFDAIDDQTPAMPLDQAEVEDGVVLWEPYNNATLTDQDDDLQGLVDIDGNYSKSVMLKISGTEDNDQDNIYYQSGTFTVAPYFAYRNNANAIAKINPNTELNLNSAVTLIEAWIRPHRFPTEDEEFFPIFAKKADDGSEDLNYALRLLPTGQLEFEMASSTGNAIRTAVSSSDIDSLINRPNVVRDTTWYHVAVYLNLANGGESTAIFYIDGTPHWVGALDSQLGSNITVDATNNYPAYVGYEPGPVVDGAEDAYSFIGDIKSVRFWNGYPGNQTQSSNVDNSDLTKFIQGAATVRADELGIYNGNNYAENLVAAYIMNGGSWSGNGILNSIASYPEDDDLALRITGTGFEYTATEPFLKLVKPAFKQRVSNNTEDLTVRWTGFDYERNDGTTFRNGSNGTNHADLEFSVEGGGGTVIQHYQYVSSQTYNAGYTNALSLFSNQAAYEFPGTTSRPQFAASLNVSVSDPDLNNDSTFNDQGQIAAANTNGRLRLRGRTTLNGYDFEYLNGANGTDGEIADLRVESPLFTITPQSNFTVRTVLEGYHEGSVEGIKANLGTTDWDADGNGLRIYLYENNANQPGSLVATAVSENGYLNSTTAFDTDNKGAGENDFANVPFVFDSIGDGRYFVKVDHINHLPVMSRFAAPFYFSGDDNDTWAVESGWDFSTWNGVVGNVLQSTNALLDPPVFGNTFTAYGNSETNIDNTEYGTTLLVYNGGREGGTTNALPAMVGGDVYKDDVINALDRARVVGDNGTTLPRSDVTGDGAINATDRQIVYRNSGKEADLPELEEGTSVESPNPVPFFAGYETAFFENPEITRMFIETEMRYPGEEYASKIERVKNKFNSFLGAVEYEVEARPFLNGDYVDIPVYVKNIGDPFGLGNCTYGIQFETSKLQFVELINTEEVIFSDRADLGYFPTFTSPTEDAKDPIANVRTIDINFDNYVPAANPGTSLPYEPTYIGTLRFQRLDDAQSYFFEWHPITVVYTVDGEEVTGDGDFKPINPVISDNKLTVIYPNGGEELIAGRPYNVSWTATAENQLGFIDFSSDNGASWTRITDNPVNLKDGKYNWNTPKVNSNECLIAIVNADNGTQLDKSDAPFALVSTPAEITRPSMYDDVYTSGSKDVIRWRLDEEAQIYFEFSADGLSGWTQVTGEVNSKLGETAWTLPSANTKNAVVRMLDAKTNEVLSVSTPFKVLAGTVTLTNPREGDKFTYGQKTQVRWLYDNVNQFDLQLSVDGGKTWGQLERDLKAPAKRYDWMIPNVTTDEAVIRAIYSGQPELEYDRTGKFALEGNTSVNDPAAAGYVLNAPTPNPFGETTQVSFELPKTENVTITLYNAAGGKVMTLVNGQTFSQGVHSITLNGDNLSAGFYVIHLEAGTVNLTKEVINVK
jgi:hypothetical protein